MLRYRLGKSPVGNNIIQNGDFSNGFTNWDTVIGWSISSPGASANPSSLNPLAILEYDNALNRGTWYRMNFKILAPFDSLCVIPAVLKEYRNYGVGSYSYDFQATLPIGNASLGFIAQSTGIVTDVELFPLAWNNPITDVDDSELSYTIERDSNLEGVITEYSGDIVFTKSGYAYLSELGEFCAEVPLLIERYRQGRWNPYIEGTIFLSDVDFDEKKCTARVTIEHKHNQTFINSKDTPVNLELGNALVYFIPLPNSIMNNVQLHDSSGNYVFQFKNVFNFENSLRLAALYATDAFIDVNAVPFASGVFDGLGMTTGAELVDPATGLGTNISVTGDVNFSFKDLFSELNKIFCLGWTIEEDSDGVGMVRIDYKTNFFTDVIVLELDDFTDVKKKYYSDIFYRNVKIGYTLARTNSRKLESDSIDYYSDIKCTGNSLDLVATFVQSTTLIRRKLSPITTGTNTATAFNKLVVAGESFSTTIIEGDIVTNTTSGAEASVTFVESNTRLQLSDEIFPNIGEGYSIKSENDSLNSELFIFEIDPATKKTKIFAGNSFNGNIDPSDNAARWIEFLPSTLRTNNGTYSEIVKTNLPIVNIYEGATYLNDLQFDTIRSNPLGKIGFTIKGVKRYGWIKLIERNEKSGKCKLSLISTE